MFSIFEYYNISPSIGRSYFKYIICTVIAHIDHSVYIVKPAYVEQSSVLKGHIFLDLS